MREIIFSLFFLHFSCVEGIYFPYADLNGYYQGENAEGGTYDPRLLNENNNDLDDFNEYFETYGDQNCKLININ
jgi:hypothetical protein